MPLEQRLVPINAFVGLCRASPPWPATLAEVGFRLAALEVPVGTPLGTVTLDGVAHAPETNDLLVVECKSGANIEVDQATKLAELDQVRVVQSASITLSRPAMPRTEVMYLCLAGHADRIGLGLDEIGWQGALLALSDMKLELVRGDVSTPALREALRDPIALTGPPPGFVPVDLDSPDGAYDTLVRSALVACQAQRLQAITMQVERRRDLDWTWLPSSHLSRVWPGTTPKWLRCDFRGERFLPEGDRARRLQIQILGEGTEELVSLISGREAYASAVSVDQAAVRAIDPAFGVVNELVNRTGRFVVTGNSFALHQEVVRGVMSRYRRLVEQAEERLLAWHELDNGGAVVQGAPITIKLSRPIQDLDGFLSELFSCREPFRLWGVPEIQESIAEVEAVDLHLGRRVRFEIGASWIRVFLYAGGCGNSIARLVSNLQHSYDASLSLFDADLAEALSL